MTERSDPNLRNLIEALLSRALATPGHSVGELLLLAETALTTVDQALLRSALGRLAHALADAEAAGDVPSPAELRAVARLESRASWRLSPSPAADIPPVPNPELKCSFCGKSHKDVRKIIAGPGVYICDECIDLCNDIIEEENADRSS